MTVKNLIAKLKKMPQDLPVYWADHDHEEYETNALAKSVELIDPDEMMEWQRQFSPGGNPDETYVVIRP